MKKDWSLQKTIVEILNLLLKFQSNFFIFILQSLHAILKRLQDKIPSVLM